MIVRRKKEEEEKAGIEAAVDLRSGAGKYSKKEGGYEEEEEEKKKRLVKLEELERRLFEEKRKGEVKNALRGYEEGRKIQEIIMGGDKEKIRRVLEACISMEVCYGKWDMKDPSGVCQRCGIRGLCKVEKMLS